MTIDESVGRSTGGGSDDRWFLADQCEFLRRSLDDAEREHDAGDLSDEDYAVLVDRDRARLTEVEEELAALGPALDVEPPVDEPLMKSAPGRVGLPAWRKVGIVASCLLIVLGVVLLVSHFVHSSAPGQPVSGSISQSQAQAIEHENDQALDAYDNGENGTALSLFNQVLAQDPSDPRALAYAGFLEWNIGSKEHVARLVEIGTAEIRKALQVQPSYPDAHLFDGLVLANQDHEYAAAVAQFNEFLADGPAPAEALASAQDVAPSYRAVGEPLPNGFSAKTSGPAKSTTTTTSVP